MCHVVVKSYDSTYCRAQVQAGRERALLQNATRDDDRLMEGIHVNNTSIELSIENYEFFSFLCLTS
jgi:hypothetical protein